MTNIKFRNDTQNHVASNNWRLTIGDLVLFTRSVHDFSIPGIYSEGIDGPSPGNVLNQISSERLTFDPIVFTFVIDGEWRNWQSVFDWVVRNSELDDPICKDMSIELLNGLNRPIGLRLDLIEARPTALDNVLMDVDGEVPQLVTTATFRYLKMIPNRTKSIE